jgi:hypothetical protein
MSERSANPSLRFARSQTPAPGKPIMSHANRTIPGNPCGKTDYPSLPQEQERCVFARSCPQRSTHRDLHDVRCGISANSLTGSRPEGTVEETAPNAKRNAQPNKLTDEHDSGRQHRWRYYVFRRGIRMLLEPNAWSAGIAVGPSVTIEATTK